MIQLQMEFHGALGPLESGQSNTVAQSSMIVVSRVRKGIVL